MNSASPCGCAAAAAAVSATASLGPVLLGLADALGRDHLLQQEHEVLQSHCRVLVSV